MNRSKSSAVVIFALPYYVSSCSCSTASSRNVRGKYSSTAIQPSSVLTSILLLAMTTALARNEENGKEIC